MIRDDMVYVADIIESIELIISYVNTLSEADFENNIMLQDAVYRRFEIIGEATNRLSAPFKASYPNVEWAVMKAMRNKIAHEYFGIITAIVFKTVREKLPPLLLKMQAIQLERTSSNDFPASDDNPIHD
jgi:uncharacterized protein with HEPN domain